MKPLKAKPGMWLLSEQRSVVGGADQRADLPVSKLLNAFVSPGSCAK